MSQNKIVSSEIRSLVLLEDTWYPNADNLKATIDVSLLLCKDLGDRSSNRLVRGTQCIISHSPRSVNAVRWRMKNECMESIIFAISG